LVSALLLEWVKSRREWKSRERDRELTLKKETYLPLVNALTEGMTLFLSIPQTPHAKLADLKLSQDAQNALGATGLIASERVLAAVNAASKQLGGGIMRLMTFKLDEAKLSLELENIESRLKQLNDASRLIVDRMKALQDAGKLNPESVAMMDSEVQRNQAEFRQLSSDQQQKFEKRSGILKDLNLRVMTELVVLSKVSANAVIEIRQDLEIPTDADELMRQFKDSISFVNESFPGFVDKIWLKATSDGSG
jgi:hypothetical protein